MAQASAKLSLWERKRIFLVRGSFLRFLSTKLLSPGRSTSMARSSRMRPDSGRRLSRERPTSRTRLSPDRPTSIQWCDFSWVEFVGHARFDKNVYFDGATFTGETNFTNAIFAAQSTFVNAKMKYDTSFEGTIFEWEPPKFFEAELHEGTNWNAKKWPLPPASIVTKQFVDAYACLKREMD